MVNIIHMKKFKTTILLVVLMLFSTVIFASESKISKLEIDATILENGDVRVVEKITGEFNEQTPFIRNIPKRLIDSNEQEELNKNYNVLYRQYESKFVSSIQVGEVDGYDIYTEYERQFETNSKQKYNSYILNDMISREYDQMQIMGNSPNTTFKIEYVIQNGVTKYADTAQFYWNFLGYGFSKNIDNVEIKIGFSNAINKSDIKCFLHGMRKDGYKIVNKDNVTTIEVKYKNLKVDEYITTRVLFPNSSVTVSMNMMQYDLLDMVRTIEEGVDINNTKFSGDFNFLDIAQIVVIVFLFGYLIYLIFSYQREDIIQLSNIDEEKLLKDYGPLLFSVIAKKRNVLPRDIVATILNLVNKNVLKMEKKKSKDGIIYEVSKSDSFNYADLDDIEKYVYDWFLQNDDKVELISRLKAFTKSDDMAFKLYRLQKIVDDVLEKNGQNRRRTIGKIRNINMVSILITFVYFVINTIMLFAKIPLENVFLNFEKFNFIPIIISIILLLTPLVIILIITLTQIALYNKIGIKKIIKLPFRHIIKFLVGYFLTIMIFTTIDTFLFADISFTLSSVMLMLAISVNLTAILMSRDDKSFTKLKAKFNMIKNKLENKLAKGKLNDIKITDNDFTYAISFELKDKYLTRYKEVEESKIFEIDIMKKEMEKIVRKNTKKK